MLCTAPQKWTRKKGRLSVLSYISAMFLYPSYDVYYLYHVGDVDCVVGIDVGC